MHPLIIAHEVRKIHTFGFFWMFLPIIPILVPFQLSLGLNMQQIFWVQVCFGLVCAACEVPSGYLCDLWGRKNTLLVGALLWALGFGYLTQVHDFVGMLIYEAILGVAVSLVSGADIAMLYDWLAQDNSPRETTTQALARHQMAQVLAEAVAGGLAGALVFPVSRGLAQIILKDAINWRTPGAMRATVPHSTACSFAWDLPCWGR